MPGPTREDRSSFGLWTVDRPARDPFGDATRPALDPVGVADLATPTLAQGETLDDVCAEDLDADAAGERGYGCVRLCQLACEHLMGAR